MKTLLSDAIIPALPEPSPNAWILIGIVAAVVLISVVICVVLVKRRKKGKET